MVCRGMIVTPCPHLPKVLSESMDYRHLRQFGAERGPKFYLACLEYAQWLWQRELTARAILCLDRAMGADLAPKDAILDQHPIPYRAMSYFIRTNRHEVFMGNPRVHFQHYADRLGPPRETIRRWRAWACWHLAHTIRPDLPSDPKHLVEVPDVDAVSEGLARHGTHLEDYLWRSVLHEAS